VSPDELDVLSRSALEVALAKLERGGLHPSDRAFVAGVAATLRWVRGEGGALDLNRVIMLLPFDPERVGRAG